MKKLIAALLMGIVALLALNAGIAQAAVGQPVATWASESDFRQGIFSGDAFVRYEDGQPSLSIKNDCLAGGWVSNEVRADIKPGAKTLRVTADVSSTSLVPGPGGILVNKLVRVHYRDGSWSAWAQHVTPIKWVAGFQARVDMQGALGQVAPIVRNVQVMAA